MKRLLDGTVFEAVNGLWLSGLYGIGAGAGAGLIVGCIVGCIIPIAGNIVGAVIGCAVGAVVGLPAGVLGGGLGDRKGWRAGGMLACLLVGLAIARVWYGQDIAVRHNTDARDSFLTFACIALTLFTLAGMWVGNIVFNRLETKNSDFYNGWRRLLHERRVGELTGRQRTICLAIALLPVLICYGQIIALILANVRA